MSTVSWKNNKRKRSRKTKTEIYPSHQVKWELTGSLMLHAQNKEDSSLCSSVNVWESFVCSSAIHWELQLQDSSVIPSEMCPRCSLALQEAWQIKGKQRWTVWILSHLCHWVYPSSPRQVNVYASVLFLLEGKEYRQLWAWWRLKIWGRNPR